MIESPLASALALAFFLAALLALPLLTGCAPSCADEEPASDTAGPEMFSFSRSHDSPLISYDPIARTVTVSDCAPEPVVIQCREGK